MGLLEQSSSRSPSTLRGTCRRLGPLSLSSLSISADLWLHPQVYRGTLSPESWTNTKLRFIHSFLYAKVCTITGPANAVAGPLSRGARFCSIHVSARLFDSSAPA